MEILLILALAIALDLTIGEPPRAIHPVVWMGKVVSFLVRGGKGRAHLPQFFLGMGIVLATIGQIDDQYVDNTRYDAQKSPEAGRKSDPKTAGGYADNTLDDKKLPKFALPGNKAAPPYWIKDSEKVAFDDSKYKANDEVPGIIVAPFTGDRGDITSANVYKDGKYTLEWSRKLNTGSQYDVQFTDLNKTYYFGVSVFDNAQVRHAFSSGVNKLVFVK